MSVTMECVLVSFMWTDIARFHPKRWWCCYSDEAPSISNSMRAARWIAGEQARRITDATASYLQAAMTLGPACMSEVAPRFVAVAAAGCQKSSGRSVTTAQWSCCRVQSTCIYVCAWNPEFQTRRLQLHCMDSESCERTWAFSHHLCWHLLRLTMKG